MLALQKFIIDHPFSWKEELTAAPYNLTIKEKDSLVIFNYDMIESNFAYEEVKDARGIILEKDTWRVVRMAFRKFFNLGEKYADKIDWKTAFATSKEDGSIVSAYCYYGKWHIATNTCIDAEDTAPHDATAPFKTYRDMFDTAARNSGLDLEDLDPANTYTFEMVSPYNQIVIRYDRTKLFHILTRNNTTLQELDMNIGIEQPAKYRRLDQGGYLDLVKKLGENREGIVVKDAACHRVKIKTEEYIRLHYMANTGLTTERAVYIIWNNEQDEFLQYFPQKKPILDDIQAQLKAAEDKIESIKQAVNAKHWDNAKDVFTYFSEIDKPFADMYVSAYRGMLDQKICDMKNRNEKQITMSYLEYDRIKSIINDHGWSSVNDAFEWAKEHDSRMSMAYPPIYNGKFNEYIETLKRSSPTMYLKRFDIKIRKGENI